MDADLLKIHLANDMTDLDCEEDPSAKRSERLEYYLNMRDFTLLNLWMDKCGLQLFTQPDSICQN
jgi:hypothetical protein